MSTKRCKACSRTFNPQNSPYSEYGPSCGKRSGAKAIAGREHLVDKIDISLDDENQKYLFARKSEYQNAGEDLKGSKRHQWHENNSLEEAEENGHGEKYAQRDNYLEKKGIDFLDGITEENSLSYFARYLAIKKFPPKPGYDIRNEYYYNKGTSRKDYLKAFDYLIEISEHILGSKELEKDLEVLKGLLKQKFERRTDELFNAVSSQMREHFWIFFSSYKKSGLASTLEPYQKMEPSARFEAIKKVIESGKLSLETKERREADTGLVMKYGTDIVRKGKETPFKTYEEQVDYLQKVVGIRGLQWGQYIPDSQRKEHAKHLCEAMSDLSDVLGIRPDKLSFDGKLGLSVGARGSGKALAHYEPSTKVINVTKEGAGALAHEFLHSVDNIIAEAIKVPALKKNASQYEGQNITSLAHVRVSSELEDIKEASLAFKKSLDSYRNRMAKAIQEYNNKGGNITGAKFHYFVNNAQELFARVGERIIQKKLERQGRVNTYLSGSEGTTLYPTDEEVALIEPHFDKLMESIKRRW